MSDLEATAAAAPNLHVLVHADCVAVDGHRACALYDLSRGSITTFPAPYFPLFERFRHEPLAELLASFAPDDRGPLLAFIRFLLEHEHAVLAADPTRFPALPTTWDAPARIVDAVLDVDEHPHDLASIVRELDCLGCLHLQVRSYGRAFGLAELAALARTCHGTSIQTVQALLPADPALDDADYTAVLTAHRIVIGLVVHSASADRRVEVDYGARGSSRALVAMSLEFTTTAIRSEFDCGTITRDRLLASSTASFMELHHWNGCLNRKLSIDARGQVRNCPAMPEAFGHHREVALSEVVADPRFRRAWRLRKDDIAVCRDCQFRYACTDCRALVVDPDARDGKPLKCGYDPYTDTWSDWRSAAGSEATLATIRRRRLPIVAY